MCSYRIALYDCDQRVELSDVYRSRAEAAPALTALREAQAACPKNCILSLEKKGRCIEGHRFYRSGNTAESRAVDEVFKNLLIKSDRLGQVSREQTLKAPPHFAQRIPPPCQPRRGVDQPQSQPDGIGAVKRIKRFLNFHHLVPRCFYREQK